VDEAKRKKIDQINEWVRLYKEEGDEDARVSVLNQFRPFVLKMSNKFNKMYPGVHPMDAIIHEAQIIFCALLDEYIIGGRAHFNVLIERKLPFRLRYFFIKEIKRRQRFLSHSDEQLQYLESPALVVGDRTDEVIKSMDDRQDYEDILLVISDRRIVTEREADILTMHLIQGKSHGEIADQYGISRSRVSRIIKRTIGKIRHELGLVVS